MGIKSNNPSESYFNFFGQSGVDAAGPNVHPGIYATGGDIADQLQPGNGYVYHTYGADGTLVVDNSITNVEIMLVGSGAAGRGGGGAAGGGGGAGGIDLVTIPSLPAGTYPIVIGGPISGGAYDAPDAGLDGEKTIFNPSGPAPLSYEVGGGAGGGGYSPPIVNGRPGTSNGNAAGGGGGSYPTDGTPGAESPMGRAGGSGTGGGDAAQAGGGGGGAGPPTNTFADTSTEGQNGEPTNEYRSWGGDGSQLTNYNYDLICDPTQPNGSAAATALAQLNSYFGGGGGGAIREAQYNVQSRGGLGGGGAGGTRTPATISGYDAKAYSGSGGGGDSPGSGGDSGGGIMVIRYAEQPASTPLGAKASGGVITTYSGKTIHTFKSNGTFTTPASFSETVEYVVIGGGASGGACNTDNPGGGGAGAYLTDSTPISGSNTITVQVGDGGFGVGSPVDGGWDGQPSFFGPTRTAPGGGAGGINTPGSTPNSPTTTAPGGRAGNPGGSGGGGGYSDGLGGTASGDPFPGTIGATPANGWGHDGATGFGGGASYWAAGGGGGAGSAGESSSAGGDGGAGIQLPATFRDPAASSTLGYPGPTSAPTPDGFDTSGNYWFCGGGGGGIDGATGRAPNPVSEGGGPGGPYAGAGPAGDGEWPAPGVPVATGSGLGVDAKANSGSGGGGNSVNCLRNFGAGGSGIVLVAYPT